MKTRTRCAIVTATILAMLLAYLGGTFASAQTSSALTGLHAPALTPAQWAALQAATSLLLDGESDTTIRLPIVLKR